MLAHISTKFRQPPRKALNEPRAALFLNRFTRTLTIMYATAGIADVLGIPADAMRGRSFYYCISENCLPDAVKCLENAKGNNSIAYLRFWFRDPRLDDEPEDHPDEDSDEEMATDESVDQDMGGGVQLRQNSRSGASNAVSSDEDMEPRTDQGQFSRTSSGDSNNQRQSTHEAIFGDARANESSTSSLPLSPEELNQERPRRDFFIDPVEIEAVISCTSDGLVVCLRRARPILPTRNQAPYTNGFAAAPWALEPIVPHQQDNTYQPPAYTAQDAAVPDQQHAQAVTTGPATHDFMASIREQAVFAWALTGINGCLQRFGYGKPTGESVPQDGLPIWESDPYVQFPRSDSGNTNNVKTGHLPPTRERDIFGDPGLDRSRKSTSSGDRSLPRSVDR